MERKRGGCLSFSFSFACGAKLERKIEILLKRRGSERKIHLLFGAAAL